MTARPRLVVVDAPGGPHPELYLPSLLREFDITAVWLDVEPAGPRQRRAAALGAVAAAGGKVVTVDAPERAAAAAAEAVRGTGADGVVAFSERVVHLAQRVAGAAGLPANPPETLDALQDKGLQRRRLRAGGVPTPRVWKLTGPKEIREAARQADFPAVLKPSVGMGSLATFRVEHPGALAEVWKRARDLVAADVRVAHLGPVLLLEEELRGDPRRAVGGLGDYLSVEALVVDGELVVLAVSDKLPLSPPYRENGHLLPGLRPNAEHVEAVEQTRLAHRALGVRFGATHTELKLTPDGPRVIEVNGRVGGSVPEQLMLTADYDLPLNLARLSVGRPPDIEVRHRRWSAYLTPQPPEGRHLVRSAPGRAELAAVPSIVSVYHVVEAGQVIDSADGTASNLVRVVAVADTPGELFDLARRMAGPESVTLAKGASRNG